MKFCNFLLRVDGIREASIDDFKSVIEKGLRTYRPEHQKYLYSIEMEIIDDRFFWMSCDYDDAVKFRDYVINRETGEKEPNPRSKAQIEPKQQFFACYDCSEHFLYLNDLNRRSFLSQYLSDTLQKEFQINNVYSSVDDFCNRIKTIPNFISIFPCPESLDLTGFPPFSGFGLHPFYTRLPESMGVRGHGWWIWPNYYIGLYWKIQALPG